MKLIQKEIESALKDSGCLEFLIRGGEAAVAGLLSEFQGTGEILSEEAAECLVNGYYERLLILYIQSLMKEVKDRLGKHDPVCAMLGKLKEESVKQAGADFFGEVSGNIESFLHEKYPLLSEYKERIHANYLAGLREFFEAFESKKDEISEQLLSGQQLTKLLHISTGGADVHRHGRCVIGLKTDAGTVYYKPHDCGLDILYHEIVSRWFQENTIAANVVPGEGFAFVSCLRAEPVKTGEDVRKYYHNFGVLSALFHGLGSTDMHHENIMACGAEPAAVDIETLLGTAVNANEKEQALLMESQKDLSKAMQRTCILPVRIYKGPLISPLYYNGKDTACLPVFKDRAFTVEGYEEDFMEGFHEGYTRMLEHRDDIRKLTEAHGDATVRCLLRNTRFYAHIRLSLYKPEYLTDKEKREKVYKMLCVPFKNFDIDEDKAVTEYEWKSLLEGDIPYYCTSVQGRDLCGEDPGQVIKPEMYTESVLQSSAEYLARLSPEEEAFEQQLIRRFFEHAPVDEKDDKEPVTISSEAADREGIDAAVKEMFEALERDVIRCRDGSLMWLSTAVSVRALSSSGGSAMYSDVGEFCAEIVDPGQDGDIKDRAKRLAEVMCMQIKREVGIWQELEGENADRFGSVMPPGLYTGLGGVLRSCSVMEKAGVAGAGGIIDSIIRLVLEKKCYRYKNVTAAEGLAGLILGLEATGRTNDDIKQCMSLCADRLYNENNGEPAKAKTAECPDSIVWPPKDMPWAKRADSAYGCAGIGEALAAAYKVTGNDIYREGAVKAFEKVLDLYDPRLNGWPDGEARIRFMADKGPHSAGIWLAAGHAQMCVDESGLLSEIRQKALESLMDEDHIYPMDTLDQGNALSVLALVKADKKDRAGRVLKAVTDRAALKGSFAVQQPGVKSAFDPSVFLGTLGVGKAMCKYAALC